MSDQPGDSILTERLEFEDFGHLSEATEAWDLKLRQMDGGRFWGHITQVVTQHTRVARAQFGRALLQEGSTPAGMLTFGVPARGSEDYVWLNQPVAPSVLLVFPQNREFRSISGPGFDSYPISVAPDHLARLASDLGHPEVVSRSAAAVVRPRARDVAELRAHLKRVVALARPGRHRGPTVAREVDADTTELLVQVLVGSEPLRTPRKRLRDRAIRKAEALIEAAGKEPLRVRDVCRDSGVSWRTLNYAFKEKYGVTLKRYTTIWRLNGLREDLISADRGTRISETAALWGFWHMGALAASYRQLFGELPSETSRR